MTRMSVEEFKTLSAAQIKRGTTNKYRNEALIFQGQRFDSKKELSDYQTLKLAEIGGKIRAVVRQVSFPLQGSTRRIRVDFMIVENDGRIRFCDSKGFATPEWLGKQKQIREAYGIDIQVI